MNLCQFILHQNISDSSPHPPSTERQSGLVLLGLVNAAQRKDCNAQMLPNRK